MTSTASNGFEIASNVDERHFIARLEQDGVEAKTARAIIAALKHDRKMTTPSGSFEQSDLLELTDISPARDLYRVRAISVASADVTSY